MSRRQYEGPDMTQPDGRAGLRKRQAEQREGVEVRLRFDGLGGEDNPRMADPRNWEAYDQSKADPYDEAHGYDR